MTKIKNMNVRFLYPTSDDIFRRTPETEPAYYFHVNLNGHCLWITVINKHYVVQSMNWQPYGSQQTNYRDFIDLYKTKHFAEAIRVFNQNLQVLYTDYQNSWREFLSNTVSEQNTGSSTPVINQSRDNLQLELK